MQRTRRSRGRWLWGGGMLLLLLALASLSLPGERVTAQGGFTPTPRPLFALPNPNNTPISRSGAIALATSQQRIVTANAFSGTVSIVNIADEALLAEVPVGAEPRSLTVAPGEAWLAATDYGGGTVSRIDLNTFELLDTIDVGLWPWDVVTDGERLYVALYGESTIAEVDVESGEVLRRIPVRDAPSALTLWGDFLYVTHFNSGALSLLYVPTGQIAATVPAAPGAGLAAGQWVDPFTGLAFLPATRANADRVPLTFDTTVLPVVGVYDLVDLSVDRARRAALDVADRPVNMPYAMTFDRARAWLWVVNAGSDDVSVIDLDTGRAVANVPVGANPRGVTRYADGSAAFVYNALDGTVSVIRAGTAAAATEVTNTITMTEVDLPLDVWIGSRLFHSSRDPRLSEDRRLSCATCHFGGGADGRTWQDYPGGTANTPLLFDLGLTRPWGWHGDIDDAAGLNAMFTDVQHGGGLLDPGGPNAPDLEALLAYLYTLEGPGRSPHTYLAALVEQGAAVFTAQGCAACHPGPLYTDRALHDVGTGGTFDTPSLRWLWMSAPYLHDGRAAVLGDVFAAPGPHLLVGRAATEDLAALEAYLLSLPLLEE